MEKNNMSPIILLTGTIIPNSILVKHNDYLRRRSEYLKALEYYSRYGKVVFLENSEYDFNNDSDFYSIKNIEIIKVEASKHYHKGKGYQEFEMIDSWVKSCNQDIDFIKVTGRYIIKNFKNIYQEFCERKKDELIIDSYKKSQVSITALFCFNTDFYKKCFLGLYKKADDETDLFIEKVIYEKINNSNLNFRLFLNEPYCFGISGSNNVHIEISFIKYLLKRLRRKMNILFNKKLFIL
jgi:hypothetical protein